RLTLAVEPGEVFGFLGPNGAGKSTTLKLLVGLLFPTSGSARILGQPAGNVAVRRRIGFLPENPYFYDYLTAEELLTYYAGLYGMTGVDRTRRVSAALDAIGLGAERRMRLRAYSRGMLQRLGIAQAIIAEPDLVFLDEPMSGLDPLGRRELRTLLLGLRDRGCTVFFSSHILSDAEALCSSVGILARGRLVAHGRVADLVALEARGWELVVAGVTESVKGQLQDRVRSMTRLADDRYSVELHPNEAPERLLPELTAHGVRIVSLNPIRGTLEDYFVASVHEAAQDTSGPAR
ncbi:MAG: ABC transporter ATP-binding protein, partial [Vicinamibacterales bacterium]